MNYEKLLVQKQGSIYTIFFNDSATLNALSQTLMQEFSSALSLIEADSEAGIVILSGVGKAFVAGADISYMSGLTPVQAMEYSKQTTDLYRRMEEMDKIFIAAINGYALGGGCELSLACDLRVASTKAKFALPEVTLGILPGGGGTQRLARLIGMTKAKELVFTGKQIRAQEALALGLVNEVVEPDNLMETAQQLAHQIIMNSLSAVRLSKAAMNRGEGLELTPALGIERQLFGLCFAAPDQKEGMQAFLEKRTASFSHLKED